MIANYERTKVMVCRDCRKERECVKDRITPKIPQPSGPKEKWLCLISCASTQRKD